MMGKEKSGTESRVGQREESRRENTEYATRVTSHSVEYLKRTAGVLSHEPPPHPSYGLPVV